MNTLNQCSLTRLIPLLLLISISGCSTTTPNTDPSKPDPSGVISLRSESGAGLKETYYLEPGYSYKFMNTPGSFYQYAYIEHCGSEKLNGLAVDNLKNPSITTIGCTLRADRFDKYSSARDIRVKVYPGDHWGLKKIYEEKKISEAKRPPRSSAPFSDLVHALVAPPSGTSSAKWSCLTNCSGAKLNMEKTCKKLSDHNPSCMGPFCADSSPRTKCNDSALKKYSDCSKSC